MKNKLTTKEFRHKLRMKLGCCYVLNIKKANEEVGINPVRKGKATFYKLEDVDKVVSHIKKHGIANYVFGEDVKYAK